MRRLQILPLLLLSAPGAGFALDLSPQGTIPSETRPFPRDSGSQDSPLPGRPAPPGPPSCGDCHRAIAKEWAASAHARSWTDELYQAALKTKRRPRSCWSCHIPGSVLARLPRKPKARTEDRELGVHCLSCHVKDGKVHGPFGAETEAHESVKSEVFAKGRSDLCLACHKTRVGPVLPVGKDFLASPLPGKGKSCRDCHMPRVERPLASDPKTGEPSGPVRVGRGHRILGPSDPKFLRKAFRATQVLREGVWSLRLENRAGHRIPGLLLRAFEVRFRLLDSEGKEKDSSVKIIDGKNPLPFGGSLDHAFENVEDGMRIEITVDHLFGGMGPSARSGGRKNLGRVFEYRSGPPATGDDRPKKGN